MNQGRFDGAYEHHLAGKEVLLRVDCDAVLGPVDAPGRRREVVVALTPDQVIVLGGPAALGIRTRRRVGTRVWKVDLLTLVELRITAQGDLAIVYSDVGQICILRLLLRNPVLADSWMSTIDDAFWMSS
jgi:hypothetical protein